MAEPAKQDPAVPERPAPTPPTYHVPVREGGSTDASQGVGGHSKDVPHEKTPGT